MLCVLIRIASLHNIPFYIKKKRKITLSYPKSAAKGFFLGTQERVRNSRGKRANSVRAIEVLLYKVIKCLIMDFVSILYHS